MLSFDYKEYFKEFTMKNFYVGAAYYPELWDKAEIERDIAKMKEIVEERYKEFEKLVVKM